MTIRCAWLSLILLVGCAEKVQDEFLTADQVPAAVMAAANKVFPGLKCSQVWKYQLDGETVYELRGKTRDGKSHEATVSEAGTVLWPIKK